MDKTKLQGYLNICHKAGYLIIGSDELGHYDKKLFLVLLDSSAAKNSQKIAERQKERGIKVCICEDLESLVSIKNCKIVGIKNKGLSEKIIELI